MKTIRRDYHRDDHVFSIMYDTKCENGHRLGWVGDPPADGKIPEGTLCRCGKMKAHYVYCKSCKVESIKLIPVSKKIKNH